MYRSRKVMAIGAHPDDVEFGCSGTLCNHINNGDYVVMVVMTNTKSVDGVTGEILRTKEENQEWQHTGPVRKIISSKTGCGENREGMKETNAKGVSGTIGIFVP